MSLEFNLPKDRSSILKVIGVGGGGSNAVNHMYLQGIKGVDFIVCNTDQQALDISPVPIKIQIGETLTGGRGAGAQPEVGRNAAVESIDEIREILEDGTTMVFITAGMGGGTGTGAAPVIAQVAKELGILTVGIVTIPFGFEGPRRKKLAAEGLANFKKHVDTLLVIKNDKLRELCGNLTVTTAFQESDNILTTAAKGIAEVISSIGYINVDMNDVNTVMKDSGVAIMGSASATGEGRANKAVIEALESPLLNDNNIRGARHVLLNITFGTKDITMDELDEITQFIQTEAGDTAEVIMGYGQDDRLGEEISVTLIATGFQENQPRAAFEDEVQPKKNYRGLDEEVPSQAMQPPSGQEVTQPMTNPFSSPDQLFAPVTPPAEEQPFLKEVENSDLADHPIVQDLGIDFTAISSRKKEEPAKEEPMKEAPKMEQAKKEETQEEVKPFFSLRTQEEREQEERDQKEEENNFRTSKLTIDEYEEEFNSTTSYLSIDDEEDETEETQEPTVEKNYFKLFDEPEVSREPMVEGPKFEREDREDKQRSKPLSEKTLEVEKEIMERRVSPEVHRRSTEQRLERIREHGMKLRTPSGLSELENEPAYKRKKLTLDDVPHSSESNMSRYTLTDKDTEGITLSKNNPFLDKRVD